MSKYSTKKDVLKVIADKQAIRLDIGCGNSKMPGFVGMDYFQYGNVDIVWDIERTPWPLPDNCVSTAIASHILEHVNPHSGDKRLPGLIELLIAKKIFTQKEADEYLGNPGPAFMNVMDEIWRVMKPGGQFAFVVPHAASPGFQQDPTHINMINETTLMYFDPLHDSGLYQFYKPKPWKIVNMYAQMNGLLEVVLHKRADDRQYHGVEGVNPNSLTEENTIVENKKPKVTTVRMG